MSAEVTRDELVELSAAEMQALAAGETIGPCLIDGKPIYVSLDDEEQEHVALYTTGNEQSRSFEVTDD